MRVNIYNEEVTDRVELTDKLVKKVKFSGIQFFVGPKHTAGDDDSSAVTFWYSEGHTRAVLRNAFTKALKLLGENPRT